MSLTELDLSQNVLLESLDLEATNIQALDISQNINLNLNLMYSNLSQIDFSQNLLLTDLNVGFMPLDYIDVSFL